MRAMITLFVLLVAAPVVAEAQDTWSWARHEPIRVAANVDDILSAPLSTTKLAAVSQPAAAAAATCPCGAECPCAAGSDELAKLRAYRDAMEAWLTARGYRSVRLTSAEMDELRVLAAEREPYVMTGIDSSYTVTTPRYSRGLFRGRLFGGRLFRGGGCVGGMCR